MFNYKKYYDLSLLQNSQKRQNKCGSSVFK